MVFPFVLGFLGGLGVSLIVAGAAGMYRLDRESRSVFCSAATMRR